jgi:hypothetical protein
LKKSTREWSATWRKPCRTTVSNFDGVGPTLFVELKRPVIGTGLSLVANARGSVLFGDSQMRIDAAEAEVEEPLFALQLEREAVMTVGEFQVGVEYERQLGYGALGFVQCLWEGQVWSNSAGILGDDTLGLMGVAFNVGITR